MFCSAKPLHLSTAISPFTTVSVPFIANTDSENRKAAYAKLSSNSLAEACCILQSIALHTWLRKWTPATDVTMSVCTGAFQLARAGLLSGKSATTHHDFQDRLMKEYPDIDVKRGVRFVEGEKISTAGALTSGIDLALRVVERYFGRDVAQRTATYMEYQSKGWIV
jgi:transcriptional regulator GlxA family with amidase domain